MDANSKNMKFQAIRINFRTGPRPLKSEFYVAIREITTSVELFIVAFYSQIAYTIVFISTRASI